jgi:hypothetical protein
MTMTASEATTLAATTGQIRGRRTRDKDAGSKNPTRIAALTG